MLDEDEYHNTFYNPLLDGLNTRKTIGIFLLLLRPFRCVVMIVVAMKFDKEEFSPVQVFTYLSLSFFTAISSRFDNPYVGTKQLRMETFNEGMITLMSAFSLLQIIEKTNERIGNFINAVIYCQIAGNTILIAT